MSLDKSLKTDTAGTKHRNVLRRAERIVRLQEEAHWKDGQPAFGLVKVANRKIKVGGKDKKKAETAEGKEEEATPKT